MKAMDNNKDTPERAADPEPTWKDVEFTLDGMGLHRSSLSEAALRRLYALAKKYTEASSSDALEQSWVNRVKAILKR